MALGRSLRNANSFLDLDDRRDPGQSGLVFFFLFFRFTWRGGQCRSGRGKCGIPRPKIWSGRGSPTIPKLGRFESARQILVRAPETNTKYRGRLVLLGVGPVRGGDFNDDYLGVPVDDGEAYIPDTPTRRNV